MLHIFVLAFSLGAFAQDSPPAPRGDCHEWHECRQMAVDARARGEYERFHDLAWRTVQTGPPQDAALMYLLARAQSLSGRPHDALVMLGRLADMGVASDAATNDDFRNVRALREWPELEERLAALATPALPSAAARAPAAAEAAAPTSSERTAPVAPSHFATEDAMRVANVAFTPHGLAYDTVSSRFVVADLSARKLVIFDERSHRAIDLVRASSAGFSQIVAFEIDARRGDLWVLSVADETSTAAAATLHKLQLVSGRPLGSVTVPASFGPAHFEDVAVTPSGAVLMLDSAGRRIFTFDPSTRSVTVAATLDVDTPMSLAPSDDRTVYVAVRDGIVRVDLSARTVTPLRAAPDGALANFARIRWSRGALVGLQRTADGAYAAVEVKLSNHHGAAAQVLESNAPIAEPTALTLSGNDLYVLTRKPPDDDIVVQRIRFR